MRRALRPVRGTQTTDNSNKLGCSHLHDLEKVFRKGYGTGKLPQTHCMATLVNREMPIRQAAVMVVRTADKREGPHSNTSAKKAVTILSAVSHMPTANRKQL
jgi:hypothetical protein